MEWVAKQPEAHTSIALNFWIHNRDTRISCRKNVQVALMCNNSDKSDLPTKGELMRDKGKRQELESKVLCMTSHVRDSDSYWQKIGQELVGTERYLEDPPSYGSRTPQNAIFFQTRALPYFHHPAIFSLYQNYEKISKLSDEKYFKARVANTLEHPSIPQWVGAFMNEMDTKIVAPILYDSNIYFQRAEWGQNTYPHWHRLLFSEKISKFINELCVNFKSDIENKACNYTGCTEKDRLEFRKEIKTLFQKYQYLYMSKMKNFYTNWNAGLTKNGKERTSPFIFDRKKNCS